MRLPMPRGILLALLAGQRKMARHLEDVSRKRISDLCAPCLRSTQDRDDLLILAGQKQFAR
jgi:hypothetical protein